MGSPEPTYWTPLRITLWAAAAVGVSVWLGPSGVSIFRPPPEVFPDFSQEWLSARNYWTGHPIYEPQEKALLRHTGLVPTGFMLPWNAHPPVALLLALPFGLFTDYQTAHLAWNLATFPLLILAVVLVIRELEIPFPVWSIFPTVVLGLAFHPLFSQLAQGQLNFLLFFCIVAAWVADRHDQPGLAGVALGLAVGIKIIPGFLFIYFFFARRWQAILTGLLTVAAVNAAAWAVFGTDAFTTYIRKVLPSLVPYYSSGGNVSLTGFWMRLFEPDPHERIVPLVHVPRAGRALALASQVAVAACVALAAWRARSTEARDWAFSLGTVGMVLVSPIAWPHYFVLLLLPLAVMWMRLPDGWPRGFFWVLIPVLWVPQTVIWILCLGREQAEALKNVTHNPIPQTPNLVGLSVFTYVLVGLFCLMFFTRPQGEEPAAGWAAPRLDPREDEDRLNRRLFGSDGRT